jgi:hypothetical protein
LPRRATAASPELRNKACRAVFVYREHKYGYSPDTGDRDIAEGLSGGIENALM